MQDTWPMDETILQEKNDVQGQCPWCTRHSSERNKIQTNRPDVLCRQIRYPIQGNGILLIIGWTTFIHSADYVDGRQIKILDHWCPIEVSVCRHYREIKQAHSPHQRPCAYLYAYEKLLRGKPRGQGRNAPLSATYIYSDNGCSKDWCKIISKRLAKVLEYHFWRNGSLH